ncbi:SRPBCC family protein [Desmospora activa]|uniref:Uncharacterized protein YndB with AHSA1/START domain n=1 Tax=Desmospora activa DSM 45169 TaxID=1121389 RepID=A0A2T4Z974_9BACL|nr:SRPBCC family protein [Desmospora activa]PTM58444.1 uncharacterized protein YndB with AHSA1/START domain [Desmospora activa DSM 45169]
MNKYGVITEAGTIRFTRVLPGPIEHVWSFLTESEKRGKWLAAGEMELYVGGRVELNFRHADLSSQVEPTPARYKQYEGGHTNYGKVTRCEPPRLLSYTWGGGAEDESEVTFELIPRDEDVILVLTHRRLVERDMRSVASGWHTHLTILEDRLSGREPRSFWAVHTRIEGEYEKRLAHKLDGTLHEIDGRCALRFERFFPYPPEKVWHGITEPYQFRQWYPFATGEMELIVGGKIGFDDNEGAIYEGVITQLDPPRFFSFTEIDDRIHFELQPVGTGCLLLFTHIFDNRSMAAPTAAGWHRCLTALHMVLDDKAVQWPHNSTELRKAYAEVFALHKSEGSS